MFSLVLACDENTSNSLDAPPAGLAETSLKEPNFELGTLVGNGLMNRITSIEIVEIFSYQAHALKTSPRAQSLPHQLDCQVETEIELSEHERLSVLFVIRKLNTSEDDLEIERPFLSVSDLIQFFNGEIEVACKADLLRNQILLDAAQSEFVAVMKTDDNQGMTFNSNLNPRDSENLFTLEEPIE